MIGDDDKPDQKRYTNHDEYSTGPTEEQIRLAEKMLGSFNAPTYLEKRNLAEDYHPASLQPMNRSADPVRVLLSAHPVPGQEHHVVLSQEELPVIRAAEITRRRLGQLHVMTGRLEPAHAGRRAEDKKNGTLMVSYFHPVE